MNEEISLDKNLVNSKHICTSIHQESLSQCKEILEQANNQKQKILQEGEREALEKKEAILKEFNLELERLKSKIFSTLNLSKRKIILDSKSKFAQEIFTLIDKEAEVFRSKSQYRDFLKQAILEGIKVVNQEEIVVFFSYLDESIFNEVFIQLLNQESNQSLGKYNLVFIKSDFKDIGIIVKSKDEKISFDNRFSARLARVKDEIYMQLLKEA